MSDYIANTEKDERLMLEAIGAKSVEGLFCDIRPENKPRSFNIP